mgnify:CR=1 FL=1
MGVPRSRGARPIGCTVDEPVVDWVHVDVLDHLLQSGWLRHVSVITAATLLEAEFGFLSALSSQLWQPLRRICPKECQRLSRNRPLELTQHLRDVVLTSTEVNQQVHVIRHEDVRPHGHVQLLTHLTDGLSQPPTHALTSEKRIPSIATKRQLMRLPQLVVGLSVLCAMDRHDRMVPRRRGLPLARSVLATPTVAIQEWLGQRHPRRVPAG